MALQEGLWEPQGIVTIEEIRHMKARVEIFNATHVVGADPDDFETSPACAESWCRWVLVDPLWMMADSWWVFVDPWRVKVGFRWVLVDPQWEIVGNRLVLAGPGSNQLRRRSRNSRVHVEVPCP